MRQCVGLSGSVVLSDRSAVRGLETDHAGRGLVRETDGVTDPDLRAPWMLLLQNDTIKRHPPPAADSQNVHTWMLTGLKPGPGSSGRASTTENGGEEEAEESHRDGTMLEERHTELLSKEKEEFSSFLGLGGRDETAWEDDAHLLSLLGIAQTIADGGATGGGVAAVESRVIEDAVEDGVEAAVEEAAEEEDWGAFAES